MNVSIRSAIHSAGTKFSGAFSATASISRTHPRTARRLTGVLAVGLAAFCLPACLVASDPAGLTAAMSGPNSIRSTAGWGLGNYAVAVSYAGHGGMQCTVTLSNRWASDDTIGGPTTKRLNSSGVGFWAYDISNSVSLLPPGDAAGSIDHTEWPIANVSCDDGNFVQVNPG